MLVVRRIFPSLETVPFFLLVISLNKAGTSDTRNYHLILSYCAYIKGYHTDNTPLITLASIHNRGNNSEQSDAYIVPSMSLLSN